MDQHTPVKRPPEIKSSQQFVSQILLPILISITLVIGAAVFLFIPSATDPGNTAKWGSISIVFIILPGFVLGLILLALLILLTIGVRKVRCTIPNWLAVVSNIFALVNKSAQAISKTATTPYIAVRSGYQGLVRLLGLAFHKFTRKK